MWLKGNEAFVPGMGNRNTQIKRKTRYRSQKFCLSVPIRILLGGFPGGPVARTLCSQCRGARVSSLVRKLDPTGHNLRPGAVKINKH